MWKVKRMTPARIAVLAIAVVALVMSLQGWEMSRAWFWMLTSAFLALIGLQLFISWILMRVLEALSEREVRINQEMARVTP